MKDRRKSAIALAVVLATVATMMSGFASAQGRTSASDKDALRAGVAACLRGPDSGLRQCLQKVLPPRDDQRSTSPAPDSKWQSGVSTDKVDGSTTIGVALTSSDGVSGIFGIKKEATLLARCVKNRTEVFVNWPEFIGVGDSKEVKWRVDAQPVAVEWWTPSVDGQAIFAPAAIPFLKKLFGGRELVLSLGAYNKLPQSLSFPIGGAENAIKTIRDACKW